METRDFRNYHSKESYNEVLFESDNFIVIPSLGSLVEGWLLIVPKKEYLSIKCFDNTDLLAEMEELSICVGKVLVKQYGGFVMFEHGAIKSNSTVGCGVDYAHLHLVPVDFDLLKGVNNFLNINYNWESVNGLKDGITNVDRNKEYLFYKDSNGNSFIAQNEFFPSQLFRKVIAHYENIPEKFDWKINHGIENISKTISNLKGHSTYFNLEALEL